MKRMRNLGRTREKLCIWTVVPWEAKLNKWNDRVVEMTAESYRKGRKQGDMLFYAPRPAPSANLTWEATLFLIGGER